MKKQKIIYIGRFQPFHLGHLKAIKLLKLISKDIIIAIGSPHEKGHFTLKERKEMIYQNTKVHPIIINDLLPNHKYYNNSGQYILNKVGDIDIVGTGNTFVRDDFYKLGKHVFYFNRDYGDLCGTKIRQLIKNKDNSWIKLVPRKSIIIIKNSNFYIKNSVVLGKKM